MSTRLRCAEFIIDKTWPKDAQNGLITGLSGVEFLELRFVAPGQQPERPLIEAEASDISDIAQDANDLENGDE